MDSIQENKIVASKPAEFLGSFAAQSRRNEQKPSARRDVKSIVLHYLTDGWDDISIWKSAFIEMVGSMSLCYLSALISITIGNFGITQVAGYIGVTNVFLISLFIYALAPASGGHVNPAITFATMLTGLTCFTRGVLYMIGQTLGAAISGGLIRGSFGEVLTRQYQGGGCYFNEGQISVGQAFLIEIVSTFILIFLVFGVGLDPRQGQLFGPLMGPYLTACVLALLSFSSAGLAPGYPGAGMNPTRCFAFAIARGDFNHQWIWWIGPIVGCLLQSAVYHIAPPYHHEKRQEMTRMRDT